jgi:hypothetical protein
VSPVIIHGNVAHSNSEININLLSVGRQYIYGRFPLGYINQSTERGGDKGEPVWQELL